MEREFLYLLSKSCDADCVNCIIVTLITSNRTKLWSVRFVFIWTDGNICMFKHTCVKRDFKRNMSVAAGARDESRNINAHNIQLRASVHLHHYSKREAEMSESFHCKQCHHGWSPHSSLTHTHSFTHTLAFSLAHSWGTFTHTNFRYNVQNL